MDEQKEIIQSFSEMAPRYEKLMDSELYRFWGFKYLEFVSQIIDGIDFKKDELVLDVATGTGIIPAYIHHVSGHNQRIFGLDITLEMLLNASRNINEKQRDQINLLCASAHSMPIGSATMDRVICCLATHHMDVNLLLTNIRHVLKNHGTLHLADAGGSSKWRNFIIKKLIKSLAFLYFFFFENLSRAKAESSAIGNIHTSDTWNNMLKELGFKDIEILELKSRRFWAPNPLVITAKKNVMEND